MIFQNIVPILYSKDVKRSLDYYINVLQFDRMWEYGDLPNFGGVVKNSVEVFFCLEAQGHPGTWICIMVSDLENYYETIKANGAKIVVEPVDREWGLREMLIGDPDGHIIRFGEPAKSIREKSAVLPAAVKVLPRLPTADELRGLFIAIGWHSDNDAPVKMPLPGAVAYAVTAKETTGNTVIGTAWLLTDQTGFYYLRNVAVHPNWQNKRVGTAMVQAITDWLDQHETGDTYIGLHTGENLIPFYKQFGFEPTCGMRRIMTRRKK